MIKRYNEDGGEVQNQVYWDTDGRRDVLTKLRWVIPHELGQRFPDDHPQYWFEFTHLYHYLIGGRIETTTAKFQLIRKL